MAPAVRVTGIREVTKALRYADRDVRLGVRKELRSVGEPIAHTAETLAVASIPGMPRSPAWARMRVGLNAYVIYVAPRKRGTKDPSRKRRNFAPLLWGRSMEPALARHTPTLVADFDQMLQRVADRFNR